MQIHSFGPVNTNMTFGDWQARVALEQSSLVHGGGVTLASETSAANQDLRQAWSQVSQEVLPHFGRFPRV
ncbi:MAG: hypothetical protein AMXMBFR33_45340 [Candidatus Xenobia bacterium]|jgi:hypothetical protein